MKYIYFFSLGFAFGAGVTLYWAARRLESLNKRIKGIK